MAKILRLCTILAPWFLVTLHVVAMQKTGFQKWDSLVALKKAGVSTPQASFLEPYSTVAAVEAVFDRFVVENKPNLIALRPDGVNGTGLTPAGITFNTKEKGKILDKLCEWSSKGYGVSLVETYNRFDYDFCCNVLLDEEGNFTIEGVGPGFDGGDLSKSLLDPTLVITNKFPSPVFIYSDPISSEENTEALQSLPFRINIGSRAPFKEEIAARLTYIAMRLLPDMGIKTDGTPEAAMAWLKCNGCARLLNGEDPRTVLSLDSLQQIVLSASCYAHSLLRNGQRLHAKVLTLHGYDGKVLCFGAYDGQRSFK